MEVATKELNDDTPIYRIFNLHDLINTLASNKIRLSQASQMEDTNELFGIYFDLLRSGFGVYDADSIDKTQSRFREAQPVHYMTCWTRVPDNISVWSLYSPSKDSIQVETTYGKMSEAILAHFNKYPFYLAYRLKPNDPMDLFRLPVFGPVNYIDFDRVYSKLRQQCVAYFAEQDSWFDSKFREEGIGSSGRYESIFRHSKEWADRDEKVRERIFEEPRYGGPLLKDHRYSHEQEVRFVLNLTRRDGRTKEEYEAHPMRGLDDPSRHPKPEDCPRNIFVPFASSNFTGFEVDGRVEDYKLEAINNVLSKFGFEASRNSAFNPIKF